MRIEVPLPGRTPVALDDGVLAKRLERLGVTEPPRAKPPTRLAYAAAHVVLRAEYASVAHSLARPGAPEDIARSIDWDGTLALRQRLDGHGFAIAEAMDTAQRFDIGWPTARELIRRTGELGLTNGFVAGAGVDHLEPPQQLDRLADGVVHQAHEIQAAGGEVILLPLPALCERRCDADAFVAVYARIIEALDGPLYVHWLGSMFLPSLEGYFPDDSFRRVMDLDPQKVRGAKLSLLDAQLEVRLRRELTANGQILLTGDDFHFAPLILGGDAEGQAGAGVAVPSPTGAVAIGSRRVATGDFSHALLGVLDGVAAPASRALRALDAGDGAAYLDLMRPCEELGRWLFQAPTRHYKAGLAFLAWLNGWQANPMLVNHEEDARDVEHYVRAAELASQAGALVDAEVAAERLAHFVASRE